MKITKSLLKLNIKTYFFDNKSIYIKKTTEFSLLLLLKKHRVCCSNLSKKKFLRDKNTKCGFNCVWVVIHHQIFPIIHLNN